MTIWHYQLALSLFSKRLDSGINLKVLLAFFKSKHSKYLVATNDCEEMLLLMSTAVLEDGGLRVREATYFTWLMWYNNIFEGNQHRNVAASLNSHLSWCTLAIQKMLAPPRLALPLAAEHSKQATKGVRIFLWLDCHLFTALKFCVKIVLSVYP